MGFLTSVKESRSARYFEGVHPSTGLTGWLASAFRPSSSGVNVTEDTAFSLSAYWCAINAISADIAKLPVGEYVREGDERREIADGQVAILMGRQPNPETIPFAYRKVVFTHALGWGNSVSEIEPLNSGKPGALWQQHPSTVNITRERAGQKRLVYEVNSERDGGKTKTLLGENVFHVFGPSFDGVQGVSVCRYARESLGLTIAAETFGGGFFGNGSTPSGVLKHKGRMTDPKVSQRILDSWREMVKKRGTAVLEEGMEYQQVGVNPEDGQFLETRQFQIPEIARWFRMPPHKLMDLTRGTFSNIEHQSIEYVGDCLMPWMVAFEQEADRKLIGVKNPRYCRHNVAGLLRSDVEARYRAYAIGIQWGFRNPDDVRRLEDENPLPDGQGKHYLRPANMIPADQPMPDPKTQQAGDPPPANPANGLQNRAVLKPLLESYRAVLHDAYARVLKVEAERVTRAAKKGGDFKAWADGFYTEHRDHVRGALFPAAEALASIAAAVGVTGIDPNAIAGAMADRHIAESRASIDGSPGANLDTLWAPRAEIAAVAEIDKIAEQITGAKP